LSWLDELGRELTAIRIPARRRRRIIAELDDHLRCDPSAADRLGDPSLLAAGFADEVGSALSRRAAFAVVLALAPFGLLFGALFTLHATAHVRGGDLNLIGPAVIIGTQIAFVGGTLALLRAWRLRQAATVPAAEAAILARRAALGLAGGLITAGAIALAASQLPAHVSSWFAPLAYTTAGLGVITLTAAGVALGQALRLQPTAPGPGAGDLESDLGSLVPGRLRGNPWRLALAIAGIVALCITIAGIVQADPFDGLARALADALACLAGFALLGRWLGLRT
jgi:hypothetical protein